MRILQIGKFYPIVGGVEKVMFDLMNGLSSRGVDCDMLCAGAGKQNDVIQLNDHARIICTKTWFKLAATMISPEMIWKLREISSSYDILHVHHPDPMACLSLMLSGYKGKVVVHWHSDIEKQKFLLRFFEPLQRWMLKRADVIVGTTPVYLAESPFLQDFQDKTMCLPIGIEAVRPDDEKVKAIRAQYPGKRIIFTLGRLVPYKGYRYLVEAATYLPDDYVVLIGGSGPLKDELLSQIKIMGLDEKVRVLGRVEDEDLAAYYGACSLFCLSSVQKTEAFAIVQIEAMSCSKPVVATRIPHSGVSWVNAHGESGVNAEPRDAQDLARCILEVLENPDRYSRLSSGAKERFERLFRIDRMIDGALGMYQNLLK